MKSLNSVRRNFALLLPVILFLVAINCYSHDKDKSGNHPMIILKDERVMEIRNLANQPTDAALLKKLLNESLFKTPPDRFELPPASDSYPDVDTYRDLEFYLEAHPGKNSTNVKPANFSETLADLPEENYGPSRGRLPMSYYRKIVENMDNKILAKEWANLAIGHFLDDE
ncbi:MAG: hypothetical protein KAI29_01205, partial [Cyclobacteriaceae bacterium]|nr:hypothetical protein [Cyclobacteriaceae bacterium]